MEEAKDVRELENLFKTPYAAFFDLGPDSTTGANGSVAGGGDSLV